MLADTFPTVSLNTSPTRLSPSMARYLATPARDDPYVAGVVNRAKLNRLFAAMDMQQSQLSGRVLGPCAPTVSL